VKTCLCKTPKTTFTYSTTTGEALYLCSFHAQAHRDGHSFTVVNEETT
jgi:hypothetical protein